MCGREVVGDNAEAAHADTFDQCLNICDIIPGCQAVTFLLQNPPPPANQKNCHPYRKFNDYAQPAGLSNLLSGVTSNRAILNNTFSYAPTDCQAGSNFADAFGTHYRYGCNQTITGTEFSPIVTGSLNGCMLYCSTLSTSPSTCVGVRFTGYPAVYDTTYARLLNCYPKSDTGSPESITSAPGTSYAKRLP